MWLSELGYRVTLLESNGSRGGRTIGLTSGHGDAIDNGRHVFAGSWENVFGTWIPLAPAIFWSSPTGSDAMKRRCLASVAAVLAARSERDRAAFEG